MWPTPTEMLGSRISTTLYRQDLITHHQLAQALGMSRYETDGVLKRHQVSMLVTAEEMRAQAASLREVRPE